MSRTQTRILVADDEPRYVRAIKVNLEANGYEVITAQDGQMAVELAADLEPDLVLLDIKMPRLDGYAACQRIREFSKVPIIMLTALVEDNDKVKGLDAGADDYVTKPFSSNELMARVRAALRRGALAEAPAEPSVFQVGELKIDFSRHRVFVAAHEVGLTSTEYRLLCALAHNAGRVLVPERLLDDVWGPGYAGETHLVWQAIHRLRHKIEADSKQPQYILTKSGIGYYMAGADEAPLTG